jgi:hypothetical protein
MKLIDILVRELPNRGGWPEGIKSVAQSSIDGGLYFYDRPYDGRGCEMKSVYTLEINDEKGAFLTSVTRTQYEAALAASKPEWNGEGLPPVGCECEIAASTPYLNIKYPEGAVVKIYSHFTDDRGVELAAFVGAAGKVGGVCTAKCFRPIRTEADKKRDAAIESLMRIVLGPSQASATVNKLYDAIAAGKIPGIKLED